MFSFPYSPVRSELHREVIECAFLMNLICVEKYEKIPVDEIILEQTRLFVTKLSEIWRIDAYLLTRNVLLKFDWSDGMEYLESSILGYNEEECFRWISYNRNKRVGWLGKTVYTILCSDSLNRLKLLGFKAINPYEPNRDIQLYASRNDSFIENESLIYLNSDRFIFRFALTNEFFDKIFGKPQLWGKHNIIKGLVKYHEIPEMNESLQSKIYLLTEDGWR